MQVHKLGIFEFLGFLNNINFYYILNSWARFNNSINLLRGLCDSIWQFFIFVAEIGCGLTFIVDEAWVGIVQVAHVNEVSFLDDGRRLELSESWHNMIFRYLSGCSTCTYRKLLDGALIFLVSQNWRLSIILLLFDYGLQICLHLISIAIYSILLRKVRWQFLWSFRVQFIINNSPRILFLHPGFWNRFQRYISLRERILK